LSACGKRELSRAAAQKYIQSSQQVQSLSRAVPIVPGEFRKGFAEGLWTPSGLTEKGGRDFLAASQTQLTLRNPASVAVEVTGITDVPMTQNMKEAQFTWTYHDMPSVAKRFAVHGGSGTADFRLYDDGWRLEDANFNISSAPMILSATEQQAELRDAHDEQERVRATIRRLQEEQKRLAKRIEESKQTDFNKPIATFAAYSAADSYEYLLTLKLFSTGLSVSYSPGEPLNSRGDRGGPKDGRREAYWFGDAGNIQKDVAEFIWSGIWRKPAVSGLGEHFFFKEEADRDQFYDALMNAYHSWQRRFPDVLKALQERRGPQRYEPLVPLPGQ
jgi:hypothetical protein